MSDVIFLLWIVGKIRTVKPPGAISCSPAFKNTPMSFSNWATYAFQTSIEAPP